MSWTDFAVNSALERDLLQRALPLMPTASDGSSSAIIDLAANRAEVAVSVSGTLGPTPDRCIHLLGLRPLLVGAAWKVLDLLLETALDEAGGPAPHRRTIDSKKTYAWGGRERPGPLTLETWAALTSTYAATVELRNSLVHRRAYTDASNALIGTSDSGKKLAPLTAIEQEAFVRSALRAAQLVTGENPDSRVEADLIRQLGVLSAVHGRPLPIVMLSDAVPEITVLVDLEAGATNRYVLDVRALWARQPFQGATHADLIVRFRDRPGQDARGRLENAPKDVVVIEPDSLPAWLS